MSTMTYPQARRRLRLGFVGGGQSGSIGAVHANGARLSNRWDITAGALSSDGARAREAGREWMLAQDRIYTDFQVMAREEAVRADGIDAVAIVTPNHLHAPVAAAFMAQGIDVICDKPLAVHGDEALALARAHAAAGVVFGMTYVYASHVMVRQARAMVRSGELGAVRQVHVEYLQEWALELSARGGAVPWRLDPALGGPSFTTADIGTHAEHLVRFVTGLDIVALRADFHVTGAPKPLEDTAFMNLRLEGDVPGTLIVSQTFPGAHCGLRLRIAGTRAALEWHQEQPEILHLRPAGQPERIISRGQGAGMAAETARLLRMPRGHPEALTDAWANLYLELAVAIAARREGRTLPDGLTGFAGLEDGVKGMAFVMAAVQSNASGEWVELNTDGLVA